MRTICAALLLCLAGCEAPSEPDGNIYLSCSGFFGLEPTNLLEMPQEVKMKFWIDTANRQVRLWNEEDEVFVDMCAGMKKCSVDVDSHNIRTASSAPTDTPGIQSIALDFDRVSGHVRFTLARNEAGRKSLDERSADLGCVKIGPGDFAAKAF